MRVAVHYAYDREELDKDPFRKIKNAADSPKEKGILTFNIERKVAYLAIVKKSFEIHAAACHSTRRTMERFLKKSRTILPSGGSGEPRNNGYYSVKLK
jgi:hypothetical protein